METKLSTLLNFTMHRPGSKQQRGTERPPATQPRETEALLVQLLIKSGLFLHRELNQVCQHYGLNTNQFNAINEIILRGPISQRELCERLLFEKSNVSKIVKTLLDKSLINVSVAPNDRRSTLLIETEQGTELWKACLQKFHESSTDLLSILSAGETQRTVEMMKKLEQEFLRRADK